MASPQAAVTPSTPLDGPTVQAAYERLAQSLETLAGAPGWEAFLAEWNRLKERISGERARRDFKEAQDTRDQEAEEANRQMREDILPVAEAFDAKIRQALLAAPERPELERRYGSLLFAVFANEQATFAEANIALNVEAGELTTRFERILGGAAIPVDGETLTLTRTNALLCHPDEAKRKAAWIAQSEWITERSEDIHGIYSGLVALRQQMAENLGEPNFVPVGYRRMNRLDYGPEDVSTFRESIKRHIVPLVAELRRKQAEWLGVETIKPWNMGYFPGFSLRPGVVPIDEQWERAQALFDRLHPKLGAHYRRMVDEGLIDLENRPGKRPGAFCTSFDDAGQVAIFCNSTGDAEDVSTLTHEMGHAFQGWESQWVEPIELRWPTLEACEVHSMGMEFLSLHELETFFSPEDARKFRLLKLIDTVTILPYIAVVDAFQHWVYEHPAHSPAERDAAWSRIWDEFVPGVDFSGYEAFKAVRWKRQIHLFSDPFYYIDYAIAESGALQLWLMAETDRAQAMETYLKLCHIGGSESLLSIFRSANMVSPFDPDVFSPAVEAIKRELEL